MFTPDYTTDPVLEDFVELRGGRGRILVRRSYAEHAAELGLEGDPEGSGGMAAGGRAAHPLVELPGGERALVRRYHRGGAIRHVNRATYLRGRRSYHELWVTERARAAGVSVPFALAAAERRRRLGYSAWLATRWIPDACDLAEWLTDDAGGGRSAEAILEMVGRQISAMHEAGIAHPDLNLRNVLVGAGGGDVYLLDFDRARVGAGPVPARRRRADISRMLRSARKLGVGVTAAGLRAMASGYGEGWPLAAGRDGG